MFHHGKHLKTTDLSFRVKIQYWQTEDGGYGVQVRTLTPMGFWLTYKAAASEDGVVVCGDSPMIEEATKHFLEECKTATFRGLKEWTR